MEAAFKRNIRPLSDYGIELPEAPRITELVSENATQADTIALVKRTVKEYRHEVEELAADLEGKTVRETCRNIWDFCYHHIQYTQDEENVEQVRTPGRTLRDAEQGVDCDCFSVLVSSLLTNLGIRHSLRLAKYEDPEDPDPAWSHIYIAAHDGRADIVIDPVLDIFNHEAPYLDKKDIPMNMKLELLKGPSVDADILDFFGEPAKETRTRTRTAPQPRPAHETKLVNWMNEQKAAGKMDPALTVAQYQAQQRQAFIARHGMTPEAWRAKIEREQAAMRAESQRREAQKLEQLRAELRKRGVGFDPNAGRDELIRLLNANPAPRPAAQLANKVNKFNPGAAALRQGLLIAAKINYMGAGRAVWGLLDSKRAAARGMGGREHSRARVAWQKLRNIHFASGGKVEKLVAALEEGAYNKKKRAVTPGEFIKSGGLAGPEFGAVTAAAALAAASTVLGAIAALLKDVKPADEKPGEVEEPSTPQEAEAATKEKFGDKIKGGLQDLMDKASGLLPNLNPAGEGNLVSPGGQMGYDDDLVKGEQAGGQTEGETNTDPKPKEGTDWAGIAKWTGIVAGIAGAGYLGYRYWKGKQGENQEQSGGGRGKTDDSPKQSGSKPGQSNTTRKAALAGIAQMK